MKKQTFNQFIRYNMKTTKLGIGDLNYVSYADIQVVATKIMGSLEIVTNPATKWNYRIIIMMRNNDDITYVFDILYNGIKYYGMVENDKVKVCEAAD